MCNPLAVFYHSSLRNLAKSLSALHRAVFDAVLFHLTWVGCSAELGRVRVSLNRRGKVVNRVVVASAILINSRDSEVSQIKVQELPDCQLSDKMF